MKTEDVVLLIGAAVVGWIILQMPRRPSSTSSTSSTPPRTGTVTAGNLTFATRPSLYSSGSYLQSVWNPDSPMVQPGWDDA